jgi:hypothetical protein
MTTNNFAGVYLHHLLAIALKALDADEGEDRAAARRIAYNGASRMMFLVRSPRELIC